VLWDINSQDLKIDDPAEIAEQLKASIFPGAVVLMHDLQGESSPTAAALEILLPQLAEEGYRFVTVCE
jgi:peptidoglycan/xylan/chitin deacetylase (PgdA/CDA1 family)